MANHRYATPPFYWRGGDVLHEKEYLFNEYHRAAKEALQQVRSELQTAAQTLQERDGHTRALAGFLDGDADSFLAEMQLKSELCELEKAIVVLTNDLHTKLAVHNPGVSAELQKEKAYYLIEIEREIKAVENARAGEGGIRCHAARDFGADGRGADAAGGADRRRGIENAALPDG